MRQPSPTVPPDAATPPADPRERQGREFLAEGRFRKARDLFKELCKRDRPAYLPLLIEANLGLAREMIGKGLISEAEQVAAYLKTIAPASAVETLNDELASHSGDWKTVAAHVIPQLARAPDALPPDECKR